VRRSIESQDGKWVGSTIWIERLKAKDQIIVSRPLRSGPQSSQRKHNFFKIRDQGLTGFYFRVFSANPVGSARDNGFFLSPASLETQSTQRKIPYLSKVQNQDMFGYLFVGL